MLDRRFLDVNLVVQGVSVNATSDIVGTQYIVGANPTGKFAGAKAGQIARWDGKKWIFTTPKAGQLEVINLEAKEIQYFDGTEWKARTAIASYTARGFKVADYTAVKVESLAPNKTTGYNLNDIYLDTGNNKIYRANDAGVLEDKTSEYEAGTIFHYLTTGDIAKLWNWNGSNINGIFSLEHGDYMFDKQAKKFYAYNADNYNFYELGTLSDSPITQINNGEFFYNEGDKTFYYCDTKNNVFARFEVGGEGSDTPIVSGGEAIAPVLEIVDVLPASSIGGHRYASKTDFKIYEYDGTEWTTTDIPSGGLFLNKADGLLYVYDGEKFEAINKSSGGGGDEIITETHTLTAEEATAQSFTLANSIKNGKESNVMLSVCGVMQIAGTDYTASGNSIGWSDKTLADIGLQAGDVFIVHYAKA